MKTWLAVCALTLPVLADDAAAVVGAVAPAEAKGVDQPLLFDGATPGEKVAAWTLLFDGRSLDGWRPYGKPAGTPIGPGWKVEDGLLHKLQGVKGGDIVTVKAYADFELEWTWRLAKDANNGVKYCVDEARPGAPGYEYQMLDDLSPKWNKLHAKALTASFYEVLAPAADKPLRPAGEWNTSRVVVRGNRGEHWLNGKRVLAYEFGSEAVRAGVADSKFKKFPDFGTKIAGPVMLTDHTDECWYRTVRIREIPPPIRN